MKGCSGVFHVAASMEFEVPANEDIGITYFYYLQLLELVRPAWTDDNWKQNSIICRILMKFSIRMTWQWHFSICKPPIQRLWFSWNLSNYKPPAQFLMTMTWHSFDVLSFINSRNWGTYVKTRMVLSVILNCNSWLEWCDSLSVTFGNFKTSRWKFCSKMMKSRVVTSLRIDLLIFVWHYPDGSVSHLVFFC